MSDRSKAEKLALARRKLKEYQRKEKDTSLSSTRSAPRRGTTKHVSNDAAKKTTKESFVFDAGPSPVQQECQTSDDGSYCPSPEIKSNEEYCNSFSRNEVNGSYDASKASQLPLSQHTSFASSTPKVSPSVADMFSSTQTTNNEAEMFFNSIPTSNSLGENSNNYSSFPYQTSSFIAQEIIYQKPQSVNGVTTLSSQYQSCPSEVTEAFSNPQSGADFVQTDSHFTGKNIEEENVSDSFEFDSTKTASILHSSEAENCAGVTIAQQKDQNLPSENSPIDFLKETLDEVPIQQPLPQLSSVDEDNKLHAKGGEHMSDSSPQKLTVDQNSVCEETATKLLPLSSTESLRQMSLQINDLIGETFNGRSDDKRSSVSELEHRNQELAAMLAVEQQKNEQLHLQLKEHQSRLSQLESDLGKVRAESEAQLTREVGPLQEQLQLHAQTVGILVGEKTELQSALNKSQQLAKQKAGEVEELQGRLKASRHKVTELEKELSASNTSNQQLQNTVKELSAEVEKLKVENKLVTKHLEETEEEKSEIQQKLNTKTSEVSSLQQQLQERQSQLSLTQLRIQQLSISGNTELDSQMETLNQQKISLEHQVAQLQQAVRSVTAERDQASQQYQQYVQQLNSQLQSLASKLESATTENENLLSREQSLIHHVSELEKQLQQQQQQQQSLKTKESTSEDSDKIHKLQEKLSDLEEEKRHLHDMNDAQQQQIEALSADLRERLTRIEDLESMIESMKEDQPNKERLLAAIESDKVAAARAVAQNQKLKERLEELENGFVTMSNTKLELTEKLQYEQHVNKEKCEQIVDLENELKNIRQQLQEKEVALQQLESKLIQPEKTVARENDDAEVKQTEQNSLLNQELIDAKALIEQLKQQNSELRVIMEQQKSPPDTASVHNDKVISSLSASIQQLEAERDSLLSQLQQAKQNISDNSQSDVHTVPHEEPVEMKEAMEKLQEKFKKTMEEVAELSEEKQRLEHLVLQLQGETETIGEYIALYQVQRNILRQRAKENDEQLARVSRDREEMKMKLQELSALVRKLVSEKESSSEHVDVHLDENKVTPVVHQEEAIVEIKIPTESESHHAEVEKSEGPFLQENVMNKEATAEKIIALLSEIGSSNLVDPQTTENFHPCPWCSGRLLTV